MHQRLQKSWLPKEMAEKQEKLSRFRGCGIKDRACTRARKWQGRAGARQGQGSAGRRAGTGAHERLDRAGQGLEHAQGQGKGRTGQGWAWSRHRGKARAGQGRAWSMQ